MKANRFLTLAAVIASAALLATSCGEKYDDTAIKGRVGDLENRVTTLEEATAALKVRLDAGALVKSVTPITEAPGGWHIEFTSGTPPYIDVMNGTSSNPDPGADGVSPLIEVRTNTDGTRTIWYNVTHNNGVGGTWVNTGADLSDGQRGEAGTPGANAVTPRFKVDENLEEVLTLWYNVTEGYPPTGWVDLEVDLEAPAGPVVLVADNGNGTMTFTLDDETEYTFGLFSTAEHFEIMNVTLNFAQIGVTKADVLFRVNPSTASVPTDVSKWTLDQVATRASYVNETAAFSLQGIAPSGGTGQYVATIVYGDYDTAVGEYVLALVLDNGTDVETGEPILISSAPFGLKEVPAPTIVPIEENGTVGIAHSGDLVVGKTVTLTAVPDAGYIFKQWTFKLDGEAFAYEDLNGRDQTKNVNSAEIEFWMPNGVLEVIPVFVDEDTAFNISVLYVGDPGIVGTITTVPSAASGTTVTLTAAPAPGYYLKSYSVAKYGDLSAETEVTIATGPSNVANNATFAMPAYDVEVLVNFAPLTEADPLFATINGVAWAKANVNAPGEFASAPEAFGAFYQFGVGDVAWSTTKEPITVPKTAPVSVSPVGAPWNPNNEVTSDWDMATANPCPEGYVVPDEATALSLIDRTAVSISAETLNSVSGYRFVDRVTGENIFLPGASHRINTGGVANSTNGWYWTSTTGYNGPGANFNSVIYFYGESVRRSSDHDSSANPVRCVKAE